RRSDQRHVRQQQQQSSFFFQAEDGIRYYKVTGVQTCALPISSRSVRHTSRSELAYDTDAGSLLEVCRTLRDAPELAFEMLMDLEIGRASCRERGRWRGRSVGV